MRRRGALLLMLALLLLAACGRKGPVQPAFKSLPKAPQKLALQQQGESFQLAWGAPSANQDGSPLTDLAAFEIWRMPYDPANPCPECFDLSELRLRLEVDAPEPAVLIDGRYYVRDRDLAPDTGYQYRVVAVTRGGRAGEPATLLQAVSPAPPPPEALTGEGLDRLARLRWQPPAQTDPAPLGYRVYRNPEGMPFLGPPLNHGLLKEPVYEDLGVANGVPLRYTVRSVVEVDGVEVESAPAPSVTVTPEAGR